MNISAMQNLILNTLADYGTALLAILGAVIGIGVAYLIFRFGWKKVKTITNGDGSMVYTTFKNYSGNFKHKVNGEWFD